MTTRRRPAGPGASWIGALTGLWQDRRASISLITALAMPALVGGVALGTEATFWVMTQHSLQNAADAAAIAAATNAGANYATEAKAVAAQYGFVDGQAGVAVTASNTAACPAGGSNCYSVKITTAVPLFLSQVVGFAGTTTLNGAKAAAIGASAVAAKGTIARTYCILALAGSGVQGFRTNGNPKADLAGCNIMSDTTATCNGHDTNADYGDAHGTNDGCGVVKTSNMPVVADPYSGLASNIPADPCAGSYPQAPSKKKDPALPAGNLWSGSKTVGTSTTVCGDLQLSGNVTINTTGSGGLLVIQNGKLDTNGFTLTGSGSGLTVVFAGANGAYTHGPTGGGVLDFAAPTTGTWKGMAIYQAPSLTSGVDISDAGNAPAWDITGMVYLPHASVTFSGIINKATAGKSCFGLVIDNITVNGTGKIFARGECGAAGLTLPTGSVPGKAKLVG